MRRCISALFIVLCAALAGCGSSSSYDGGAGDYGYEKSSNFSSAAVSYAAEDSVAEEAAYEDYDVYDHGDAAAERSVTEEEVAEYGSKIIRNAALSMDVKDLDEFSENLKRTVEDYGGYMESSDVNSYDSDYSEERYGYFTARIPAARLDDFLNIVSDEGTVTSKSETAEDVTLQYVDIEAHISTYEAERDSLTELLDRAESVEDIISIREQLSNVNYELDSLKRQLKSMENKVSYSTVNVSAKETRMLSMGGNKSFFSRVGERFKEEFIDGWDAAFDVLIFIVTRIPLFIIIGLFIFIVIKIVRKIAGRPAKPRMTRAEKKQAKLEAKLAKSAKSGSSESRSGHEDNGEKGETSQASKTHFTSNVSPDGENNTGS